MNYKSAETDYSRHFPILREKIYGKRLVYLDNAATPQKPDCVIDTISQGYRTANANVHRGNHFLSNQATNAYEGARKCVTEYINADSESSIIFTSGATESLNMLVSSGVSAGPLWEIVQYTTQNCQTLS